MNRSICMFTVIVLFCVFVSIEVGGHENPPEAKNPDQHHKDPTDEEGNFVTGKGLHCDCHAHKHPVCGSDRRTYKNDCILKCVAAAENSGVKVHREKPCTTSPQESHSDVCIDANHCGCDCDAKETMRICANDGVSYQSRCYMNCDSKKNDVEKNGYGYCPAAKEDRERHGLVRDADVL